MIISLNNYPNILDAKAWLVTGDLGTLKESVQKYIKAVELGGDPENYPTTVTKVEKEIIGVMYKESADAVNEVYGFDFSQCIQYGDIILIGNRHEIESISQNKYVVLFLKNTRSEMFVLVFDALKFVTEYAINPQNPGYSDRRLYCNYGKVKRPSGVDIAQASLSVISLVKDDRAFFDESVLTVYTSARDIPFGMPD